MKNKWLALTSILSLGLFLPQAAFAIGVSQALAELLFKLFLTPFLWILQLEFMLLPKIAAYNNFINEPGVVKGWTILRDLANMFFIVVLLIIAFATILRIKSYGFKQLLSRFIIVVILVNFSRTIIGLVIDFFQIVMLSFVNAIKDVISGNVIVALGLENLMSFSEKGVGQVNSDDLLVGIFIGGIMLVVACVVVGIFIITLVMRIINIWLLVVAAPMAFLAYTIPRSQKYFSQWAEKLFNVILVGPVIAFLLWLSFTIVGSGKIYDSFKSTNSAEPSIVSNPATEVATMENVFTYVIGISFLFGSLLAAKSLGTVGASLGSQAAGKLKTTASSLGKHYAGGAASRAGALASRGIVNKDGEARRGWAWVNRVPLLSFWSGRLQRGAQKMQGYDAARIKKLKETDEKYILPQHKEAFEKSQATRDFVPSLFGKKARVFGKDVNLGKIGSTVTSLGGSTDRDKMLVQNEVDRGTIHDNEATVRAARLLDQTGDEERKKKLQTTRADAYQNEEEVRRAVQEKGPAGILSSRHESNSIANDKGEATEGAGLIAHEIINNDTIGGEELAKAFAALPPKVQDAWMAVFRGMGVNIQDAFKKVGDKNKFDSDSTAGKQIMISLQNAPQKFVSILQQFDTKSPTYEADINELLDKVSKGGMDFGKLAKMDLNIKEQKEAFTNFAKHASNAQQRQLFEKGSEEQIQLMVDTLLDDKKEINNVLRSYKEKSPHYKGKKHQGGGSDDYDQQQDYSI